MELDSPRILIVDDKEEYSRYLADELRAAEPGWTFATSKSKVAALSRIQKQLVGGRPFALIITDLDLKDGEHNTKSGHSGFELIETVSRIDPLAMTILYTSKPDVLKQYNTSKLGAFDVVVKADPEADPVERILERARTALRYRSWAVRIRFLRRYFAPQFWDTIDNDPSLLEPKSRNLTIAFWDIRGFSGLCDNLREDPDLVAGFLKGYCDMAAKTILDSAGLLDKFIGDGVMALFGVFDQTEAGRRSGAMNAVRAAKLMLAGFEALIQTWMPKWETRAAQVIEIRLGCGIHTGRALVGNLGTEFRDQFTAVGPHVNFAQRLESLAGKEHGCDILISTPTYASLDKSVSVNLFKEITDVKNIPGTYRVYCV